MLTMKILFYFDHSSEGDAVPSLVMIMSELEQANPDLHLDVYELY